MKNQWLEYRIAKESEEARGNPGKKRASKSSRKEGQGLGWSQSYACEEETLKILVEGASSPQLRK